MKKRKICGKKEFKVWMDDIFKKMLNFYFFDAVDLVCSYSKSQIQDGLVFSIKFSKPYHQASIVIYPIAFAMYEKGQKEDLIQAVAHELSHIHTIPIAELAEDRFINQKQIRDGFEELTDIIGRYIMREIKNKSCGNIIKYVEKLKINE